MKRPGLAVVGNNTVDESTKICIRICIQGYSPLLGGC